MTASENQGDFSTQRRQDAKMRQDCAAFLGALCGFALRFSD
jgi:hypothetical protein